MRLVHGRPGIGGSLPPGRTVHLCVTAALFLLLIALFPPVSAVNGTPSVLVLHSYHPGFSWTDEEASGVLEALRERWPDCDPFIEYMDWKRHPGERQEEILRAYYEERYANVTFDVVVATDDPAVDFALTHRAELFDNTPVAFCGRNSGLETVASHYDVTGVTELNDISGTLAAALQLHPDRRRVMVILDDTEENLQNRRDLESAADQMTGSTILEIPRNLSTGELASAVASLPSDSLIVLGEFNRDREGRVLSPEQSLRLVLDSRREPLPVYSPVDSLSGDGVVGGHLLDGRLHGKEAGELAVQLVQGDRRIPIDRDPPLTWIFDHQELVRSGALVQALPTGSVLLNEPVPLHEQFGQLLVPAAMVFAGLVVIIALLYRDIRTRTEAEERLLAANSDLVRAEREARQALDELERSRTALRESEERYRNVVEDQTELISRFLPDGTHVFVNEAYCRYFGLDRQDVIGRGFKPRLPQEDEKRLARLLASLTPDHPVGTILHRTLDEDGQSRWQRWSDRAIFDEKGRVTEYQSVGRDVTEQQRTEQALSRAKAQLTLLSELSHNDLQNQLFTLRGYLGLVELHAQDRPEALDLIERVNEMAAEVARTIEFSRDFQGLGASPARWQPFNEVFLYAVSHLDLGSLERVGTLDGVEVFADPLLEKVLGGLIENVVQHAHGATRFEVGWHESDEGLVVFVEDNGPGVPAGAKEEIFHRRPGLGRSLFLAREVLGITGVSLRENGIHGSGARFELIFPKGGYRLTSSGPREQI